MWSLHSPSAPEKIHLIAGQSFTVGRATQDTVNPPTLSLAAFNSVSRSTHATLAARLDGSNLPVLEVIDSSTHGVRGDECLLCSSRAQSSVSLQTIVIRNGQRIVLKKAPPADLHDGDSIVFGKPIEWGAAQGFRLITTTTQAWTTSVSEARRLPASNPFRRLLGPSP